jgi:hypothetical protein
MPRPKKKAHELTTEQAMAKVFPKRVVSHLKAAANPGETKGKK